MANREQIGLKIKQQRKDRHLTQSQLSKLTRINKTTISEIENGRFTGSFDIFERLLDAVDLRFDVVAKEHTLPNWNEIDDLFLED
ncbi:transcriptional regulator [Vibrio sp. UCD-FRSSP16_10]|uniref:helix-turn-helix domain-containing protein n=1 Tax=unclassified Vibrio TaxID=2614977 RepID=UPI0007FCF9C3|nr:MULTISPECIES: helix-turn-helix transcriptional regulator [unclassified Vibrio]OBT13058.1 transcriptional regulator [Vibrio sp. UCD-FRSSP16_30]OBT19267.1 transcriptional regulator [Vibrio sp. UCD-FRSSP16_10]